MHRLYVHGEPIEHWETNSELSPDDPFFWDEVDGERPSFHFQETWKVAKKKRMANWKKIVKEGLDSDA